MAGAAVGPVATAAKPDSVADVEVDGGLGRV